MHNPRPALGGRPLRYLFLCGGNTCRSPIAAIIAKGMLGAAVDARSAGINIDTALMASARSMRHSWQEGIIYPLPAAVAAMKGLFGEEAAIVLAAHKAQPVTKGDLQWADRVFVMTVGQQQVVRPYCISECLNVPDPFGGKVSTYRKAIKKIALRLQELI